MKNIINTEHSNVQTVVSTDNTNSEKSAEQCSCPFCKFEESILAKEIATFTDGIETPIIIDAEELLEKLKKHAYRPETLPSLPSELAQELCKIHNTLYEVLGISFKYFPTEEGKTFVIFVPVSKEYRKTA